MPLMPMSRSFLSAIFDYIPMNNSQTFRKNIVSHSLKTLDICKCHPHGIIIAGTSIIYMSGYVMFYFGVMAVLNKFCPDEEVLLTF